MTCFVHFFVEGNLQLKNPDNSKCIQGHETIPDNGKATVQNKTKDEKQI